MDLSTILLLCAFAAGTLGAFGARFRRTGTGLADLATGLLIGALVGFLSGVVLVLGAGLDRLGILHLVYLLVVVGLPVACGLIVVPHLFDAEYRTPLRAILIGTLGMICVALGLWGTHVETTRLRVDTQGLGVRGVNRPIVIGVMADLHATEVGGYERDAVDRILEVEPDLVVVVGDLFQVDADLFADRLPEYIGLVRRLTDQVGTVAIVAGHTDSYDELEPIADAAGAVLLENELLDVDIDGQLVTIVGLAHPLSDAVPEVDPLLEERLRNNYDSDDVIVVLSHAPDAVLTMADDLPVDLFIAGHTHGGQISLPGIGPLRIGTDVPRIVAAGGLHLVNSRPIYVATGVGVLRDQAPQVRLGVRPSVGIITIVPS